MNVVAHFNYEAPDCGSTHLELNDQAAKKTMSDEAFSLSGAVVVANIPELDVALLKFSESPLDPALKSKLGQMYYAGWNAYSRTPQSSVLIHHPNGGVKKISYTLGHSPVTHSSSGARLREVSTGMVRSRDVWRFYV